jgi:hypothetical protein
MDVIVRHYKGNVPKSRSLPALNDTIAAHIDNDYQYRDFHLPDRFFCTNEDNKLFRPLREMVGYTEELGKTCGRQAFQKVSGIIWRMRRVLERSK